MKRVIAIDLTLVLLVLAGLEVYVVLSSVTRPDITVGMDLHIHLERARAWLNGESYYLARQLEGPYLVGPQLVPVLYAPPILYLLVPFTVLPTALWWAIPLGVIGFSLWRLQPPYWAWPILAAVLVYPRTWIVLLYGNPSLWALGALTAGLVWRWPLAFIPLKLTLAPFALLGISSPAFWRGVLLALLLALPLGGLWLDYLTAMLNARSSDLDYVLGEWPIFVAPVIVWLGARASRGRPEDDRALLD